MAAEIGTARVRIIPEMDEADIDALADLIADRIVKRMAQKTARAMTAAAKPARLRKP